MAESVLLPLTTEAFDAIPERAVPRSVRLQSPALDSPEGIEWTAMGYATKLIDNNQRLMKLLSQFAGRLDEPAVRSQMTQGQRILLCLSTFDGQVKNGGITQFFWNCPDLIFEVSDALDTLRETELRERYRRTVETLLGNQENWIQLRKESFQDPANPKWGPFQDSYDLLDLGWFDDLYFTTYSPRLLKRLVDYVKSHKEEFIESV